MVKYCDIFWSFFKIGAFTIGGGYAMIPLMQRELVDKHHWISQDDFLDQIAVAQAMPGVFAVNVATVTGFRLRRAGGSAVAILGNVLMPVVLILLLAALAGSLRGNAVVDRIFMGLRPAVVALVAAPVFTLAKSAHVTWNNAWIPVVSALLIWLLGVNPVFVVLAAALAGFLYSRCIAKR